MALELPEGGIEQKIKEAQTAWTNYVESIGRAKDDPTKHSQIANEMLDKLYDFSGDGFILFKPTLAANVPVRTTRAQTLSYFIDGPNRAVEEDKGFALNPWESVIFDEHFYYTVLAGGELMVMGRCTFTSPERPNTLPPKDIAVADYTFGYRQAHDGLRIFLHHSSLAMIDPVKIEGGDAPDTDYIKAYNV